MALASMADGRTRAGRRVGLSILCGVAAVALAACDGNIDLRERTGAFGTASAVPAAAPRPQADPRGVISYPTYQVAVANRGDTVRSVAGRIGLNADELARFNGIEPDVPLRQGEIVALPRRVAEPVPGTGGLPVGTPGGAIDVTTIAGAALDRAEASGGGGVITPAGAPAAAPAGAAVPAGTLAAPATGAPVRHQVVRGETAYSIARLYGVSVRALADWNGLGADMTVRDGQYLLIPQAGTTRPTPAAVPAPVREAATSPGAGTPTPVPPSAAAPLPATNERPAAAATPPSPNMAADRTATSQARLAMPVQGSIVRPFTRGRNRGIDLSAPAGSNVSAALGGTVAAVTQSTDGVSIVLVRHDPAAFGLTGNVFTVYANITDIAVERGAQVSRGQKLGAVRSGDPALVRFELLHESEQLNPGDYLQ